MLTLEELKYDPDCHEYCNCDEYSQELCGWAFDQGVLFGELELQANILGKQLNDFEERFGYY